MTAPIHRPAWPRRSVPRLRLWLLAALALLPCAQAAARPPGVGVSCKTAASLVYDCVFRLSDAKSGAPLSGAAFSVQPTMPSMPMAHNVRPVAAEPAADPGSYRARLTLEMPGTWNLKLLMSKPAREELHHRMDFGS
ncbi:FixH family protein [Ramlibacter sp.]|uniref:FixH family protein n=1 Tax=Ramlibacter sp. TaxID=1917967 RepID=UPI0017A62901|nr:FixH family protein [Ramlibacter sp.]MBA2673140.1 FixH family protein [Ramlibacter sp.]